MPLRQIPVFTLTVVTSILLVWISTLVVIIPPTDPGERSQIELP
ncbi:MAG: hypothetical protein V7L01_02385 [Nostoc sp.]